MPNSRPRRISLLSRLGCSIVLCLSASELRAEEPEIAFVSPRHLATVVGPTQIELRLDLPEGATVERVELSLDGAPLIVLRAAPWSFQWDSGDGIQGHRLQARLVLGDGREAHATVRTSPLQINQFEEVGLVNLYALVRDTKGAYVGDLTAQDFAVMENGVAQSIRLFSTERKPLRVGITLDTSLSMSQGRGDKLDGAKHAALEFLAVLQPGDEGMVVTFNDEVSVAQDLTADRAALSRAISTAAPQGGTALYDAVFRTARRLQNFEGRRVIVLLSDGRDESYDGLQPGSLHTLDEALEEALRSEVMVFTIGLGRGLEREMVRRWERHPAGQANVDTETSQADVLRRIAEQTGGRALISPGSGQLKKAFDNVAQDLHHQYLLAYVSSDEKHDGKWREIRVSTRAGHEVVTRRGYYARSGEERRGALAPATGAPR